MSELRIFSYLFFNEKKSIKKIEKPELAPILHARIETEYPHAFSHLARLRQHPAFAPEVEPYLRKFETMEQRV